MLWYILLILIIKTEQGAHFSHIRFLQQYVPAAAYYMYMYNIKFHTENPKSCKSINFFNVSMIL